MLCLFSSLGGFMSEEKNECKYKLTNEQKRAAFEEAAKPLIKYLNDYHDPHTKVIVETDSAEIVSGEMSLRTMEFVKD